MVTEKKNYLNTLTHGSSGKLARSFVLSLANVSLVLAVCTLITFKSYDADTDTQLTAHTMPIRNFIESFCSFLFYSTLSLSLVLCRSTHFDVNLFLLHLCVVVVVYFLLIYIYISTQVDIFVFCFVFFQERFFVVIRFVDGIHNILFIRITSISFVYRIYLYVKQRTNHKYKLELNECQR